MLFDGEIPVSVKENAFTKGKFPCKRNNDIKKKE